MFFCNTSPVVSDFNPTILIIVKEIRHYGFFYPQISHKISIHVCEYRVGSCQKLSGPSSACYGGLYGNPDFPRQSGHLCQDDVDIGGVGEALAICHLQVPWSQCPTTILAPGATGAERLTGAPCPGPWLGRSLAL